MIATKFVTHNGSNKRRFTVSNFSDFLKLVYDPLAVARGRFFG